MVTAPWSTARSQVWGGAGVSDDTPLAGMYRYNRYAAHRRRSRRGAQAGMIASHGAREDPGTRSRPSRSRRGDRDGRLRDARRRPLARRRRADHAEPAGAPERDHVRDVRRDARAVRRPDEGPGCARGDHHRRGARLLLGPRSRRGADAARHEPARDDAGPAALGRCVHQVPRAAPAGDRRGQRPGGRRRARPGARRRYPARLARGGLQRGLRQDRAVGRRRRRVVVAAPRRRPRARGGDHADRALRRRAGGGGDRPRQPRRPQPTSSWTRRSRSPDGSPPTRRSG